jgi:ubiquinone/menaquinone biosynthesis C-methylase UbiE
LEVGCGHGHYTAMIKELRKDIEIVAIDPREHKEIWKELKKEGHDIRKMDGCNTDFPDRHFDIVISYGVMEHVIDDIAFLKEMNRILNKKGKMLMYNLPNKYSLTEFGARLLKLHPHDKLYEKEEIRKKYSQNGFRIIRMRREFLIPAQLNYISIGLNRFIDKRMKMVNKTDKLLCKTPLEVFAQSFFIYSKKIENVR